MSIFIGQLIGFAVIIFVLTKWVVPLIRDLMRKQQDAIRVALDESASAAQKLADADDMHAKALADAKAQATHVTAEARQDSERIAAQLGEQAGLEADRIKAQGAQQVQLMRQQLVRQLRNGLGVESVAKADELVRAHLANAEAQSASVDRFLDELDSMAPADSTSSGLLDAGASLNLRAASRESLAEVVRRFDALSGGLDAAALGALADDLTSVIKVLLGEPVLVKHLADSGDNPAAKVQLVDSLFAGKIGAPALDVLKSAASQRWSAEANLVDAVEHIARLALLVRAEQAGEGEQVEEQLFRLGRVLDDQPRLTTLLSDYTTPATGRVALLNKVLTGSGSVNPTAAALLSQTVELLRGERADEAVITLAELAVARRGEVVAQVTAAAELTAAQRTRLTEILSRIYSHPVAVQLNIDPSVLGGLQIAVGEEVIDGAISSRLAAARSGLPD